jgi:integrase/recombinase XerD
MRPYEHHLREARGLSKATIINYVPFVRSFIEGCFGNDAVKCHNCVTATS